MTIPPFKPILQDKEKAYIDPFKINHDRQMAEIKKEKRLDQREMYEARQKKILSAIAEEKIVLKENNEKWKLLNVIS